MDITTLDRKGVLKECARIIDRSRPCGSVVTLNSLMARLIWRDRRLRRALRRASLVTADSSGIIFAAALLERKRVYRYPGIDLMQDLISEGYGVFLLGGCPGVAEAAAENIRRDYPAARILGVRDGFFSVYEEEGVISLINGYSPDILFTGLDVPRQEIWIESVRDRVSAGMIMGVGGSFDVLSGRLPRAPVIFRAAGAEWLWRTMMEPWRLRRIAYLPLFAAETLWRFFRNERLL